MRNPDSSSSSAGREDSALSERDIASAVGGHSARQRANRPKPAIIPSMFQNRSPAFIDRKENSCQTCTAREKRKPYSRQRDGF